MSNYSFNFSDSVSLPYFFLKQPSPLTVCWRTVSLKGQSMTSSVCDPTVLRRWCHCLRKPKHTHAQKAQHPLTAVWEGRLWAYLAFDLFHWSTCGGHTAVNRDALHSPQRWQMYTDSRCNIWKIEIKQVFVQRSQRPNMFLMFASDVCSRVSGALPRWLWVCILCVYGFWLCGVSGDGVACCFWHNIERVPWQHKSWLSNGK